MLEELIKIIPPQYILLVIVPAACTYAAIRALSAGDKPKPPAGTPQWVLHAPVSDVLQAVHDINESLKTLVELQRRVETGLSKISDKTNENNLFLQNFMNDMRMNAMFRRGDQP